MFSRILLPTALCLPLLVGCDELTAIMADPKVAQRIAEAKAIGGACRYGLRSIEDCYALNEKASKAAVFEGWKEMDQYMRENKLEGAAAQVVKPPAVEAIIEERASDSKGPSQQKAKSDKTAH